MNLTEFLGRQNKGLLAAIGIFLLVVVSIGDLAAGPYSESSVFYLLPVSFFSWFIGRHVGLIAAIVSALISLGVRAQSFRYGHSRVLYWNALVWLSLYVFLVIIIAELRSLYERERRSSHTDPLTQLPNRRAFFEMLASENARARRYGSPLTLAYIDVDHFKNINDRFGHLAGDKLLAAAAETMQNNVRQVDRVARIGGDEFAVLLPETPANSAEAVLRKLLAVLDGAMQRGNWPVTFSMGAVTFQPPPDTIEEMLSKADEAMYAAKTSGRDRLVVRELTR